MAIKPFNSVAGFSVGEVASNVILANGDITTTNITTTGVSNLNSVGNVKITGGTGGQVLSTDGSGNLSFITIGTASLNNGTSNISVLNSGNITFSVAGSAKVVTFTSTGLNVAGYLTSTGNVTGGNITTSGQLVSTVSTGTAPLSVSSTTLVSNLNADLLDGYNSAVANTANTVAVRNSDGNLSANYFVGNGAFLTGIDTSLISNGNSNVAVLANGNVTISVAGNIGVATVTGTGANINGYANVTGNVIAGGVVTDNLYYANGTPWDMQQPAGANNEIQFNDNGTFGASANFTFNPTTNLFTVNGNAQFNNANLGNAATANFFTGTLTTNAQPNITSVGTLTSLSVTGTTTAGNLSTGGTLSVTGNANVGNLVTSGNVFAPAIVQNASTYDTRISLSSAAGIIEANTNGNATQFLPAGQIRLSGAAQIISGSLDGSQLVLGDSQTNLVQNRGGNVTVQTGTGGTTANTWTFAQDGSFTSPGNINGANANLSGGLNVIGNANVGNLGTAGLVTATGNVSGGNLTTGGVVAATGNVSGGNLTTGGVVAATGNVSGGNITTVGLVSATGNIVSSANVVTDLIVGRTSSITITATGTDQNVNLVPTGTGSVNVGNFIISNVAAPVASTDAATKQYVDDIAQGLHTHDSCNAATSTTLATISGGTVTYNNGTSGVGATLTTTGTFTTIDGVTLSNGMRILVKNESNAAHNGIYDRTSSTVLTRSSDFDTSSEMAGGDFTFVTAGTLYDNTGWVMTDPVITVGVSNVTWVQFSGAGTYTAGTGLVLNGSVFSIANTTVTAGSYGNGDYNATFTVNEQGQLSAAANVAITANAANLTGTTLAATIVNSSLTSVGTLTALAVTGNATAGNVYANSGTIGASLLAGTLTTAAQPNVTSVGTLTSLTVTGTATAGNLSTGGTLSATGNANVGNLGTDGLILATGNVTGGNLTTAGALSVTGNASVGNISGTNGNLTTANVSGSVILGNSTVTTRITWSSLTTTAVTANQTIATFSVTGVTGVEFLVKGVDATGTKYSVATVQAVTDGTSVDYSTFGTVNLGGFTGALAVNISGGNIALQVTPASSNSTVWTTQYRLI